MREITEADFVLPSVVFQIGIPPGRIDILTVVSGLTFASAGANKVNVTIDGLTFPVIGREDVIANKRATGRPKDLADIYGLEVGDDG